MLKLNEERFNLAITGTGAGLWDWDMVKDKVFFSERWKNMLGYENHEIENAFSGWKDLWHPDDAARIELALNDYLEGRTTIYEIEHRLRHKDGSWHWISTRGDIQRDAAGKPLRWIGTNIDVTERKRAEELLKNIITLNPVSIQILDKEGFTLDVNPAFKLLFGSVPPANYSVFNDHQLKQKGIGKIFDQLRNGEVVHFPDVCFNPHDSIPELPDSPNWVRTIGFPICSDNNKPELFVLMQENISERRKAEDTLRESEFKFHQTFDISPIGIVMVGLDTRFIHCNLAFSQSLGYEADELVGKMIEEVTLPEDNLIGKAEMMAIVKGEIFKSQVQKRYIRKDGQVIWGEVTISLIRDTNGIAQYFLALIQNITERKQDEARINEQINELKRWHSVTLGREDRIMELKREVNNLLADAGKNPHYPSVE